MPHPRIRQAVTAFVARAGIRNRVHEGAMVSRDDRSGYVYVIQDGHGLCKIGRARDPRARLQALATASSTDLTLVATWPSRDAGALEAEFHATWKAHRVRGEWFAIPDGVIEEWKQDAGTTEPRQRVRTARQVKHTPPEDGDWWYATGAQVIECPRCGRETQDHPAVMKYVKRMDWAGMQARAYPEWPDRGWVVWRQCEHCSWMDFKTEYRSTDEIREWKVGPWRSNS